MSAMSRPLVWGALLLCAALLFLATGQYPSMGTVTSRLINQAMVYLVLGGWLIVALVRRRWRPTSPLLAPLSLAAAAYVVAALDSERPRLSLEPLLGGLAVALLAAFVFTLLCDPWFRARVGALVVVAVLGTTLAYLAVVATEWARYFAAAPVASLPPLRPAWADLNLGSPNLVGTVLLMLGPLAVSIVHGRSRSIAWSLAFAMLIGLAVLITGSRGGLLGVGAAVAALAGIGLLRARRLGGRVDVSAVLRRRVVWVPALLAAPLVVAAVPLIALRFAQGGDTLRINLWRSALAIFQRDPITGSGPGTWVQLKVETSPPDVANLILPHAHNLYIQALSELGLLGVVALAVLAAASAWRLWHGISLGGVSAVAVAAGLAAFLGQSLVDNVVNLPFICLILVVLVGWVDGGIVLARLTDRDPTPEPPASRADARGARSRAALVAIGGALVVLVATAPVVLRTDLGVLAQIRGNAADPTDPQAALAAYDEALRLDPDVTLYSIQRARELARLGRIPEARSALSAAVAEDGVGINLVSLAVLDRAAGDDAAALDHVRLAARRAPLEPAVGLNVGLLAAALGDRQLALEQLAAVVQARPAAAALPLLESVPGLSRAEIVAKARSLGGPVPAALISAYSGDVATGRRELSAMGPSAVRERALATCEWLAGDVRAAAARLEAVVAATPLDFETHATLAVILFESDPAAAARHARLAQIIQGDAWPGIAEDLTVRVAGPGDVANALPGQYPWAVYLRPYTDLVVPGVVLPVTATPMAGLT